MTLLQYLATMKADPRETPGQSLIYAQGQLSDAQRELVKGTTYGRRPYAIVIPEQLGNPIRMHNGRGLYLGATDVLLFHPSTTGVAPDGDAIATLQTKILEARDYVTEVRTGYEMSSRFEMMVEVPPHFVSSDEFTGLQAVTRFSYRLWR